MIVALGGTDLKITRWGKSLKINKKMWGWGTYSRKYIIFMFKKMWGWGMRPGKIEEKMWGVSKNFPSPPLLLSKMEPPLDFKEIWTTYRR